MDSHATVAGRYGDVVLLTFYDHGAKSLSRHLEQSNNGLRQLEMTVLPALHSFDFARFNQRTKGAFECHMIFVCPKAQAPLELFRFKQLIGIPCKESENIFFHGLYAWFLSIPHIRRLETHFPASVALKAALEYDPVEKSQTP
jgi:hypothetical protein